MDRPNIIPWPPILYGMALLLGFILGWLFPLPWVWGGLQTFIALIGLILACAGVAIDVWVFFLFKENKTTIKPTAAASTLVTTGPFQFTRNPIYVGNTMFILGLGLLFGEAWLLPLAFLAAYATQRLAIVREEAHLAAKFGLSWKDYAHRVPRWLDFKVPRPHQGQGFRM